MDLNYEVETWAVPLQTICAMQLARQILSSIVPYQQDFERTDDVMLDFAEKVDTLEVPKMLKRQIKQFVVPMTKAFASWFKEYPYWVPPVLTQYGTVNLVKSIACLMESNQTLSRKYRMACDFCLEVHIWRLGQKLVKRGMAVEARTSGGLSTFWFNVHRGQFNKSLGLEDLTQEECFDGFQQAFLARNHAAVKYFIEKVSVDNVRNTWIDTGFRLEFSLTTNASLYPMLSDLQQTFMLRNISGRVLVNLLEWPYHGLFLEAATSLMNFLSPTNFWKILETIYGRGVHPYRDYDYEKLYTAFFKLRIPAHYKNGYRPVRRLLWYQPRHPSTDGHVADEVPPIDGSDPDECWMPWKRFKKDSNPYSISSRREPYWMF